MRAGVRGFGLSGGGGGGAELPEAAGVVPDAEAVAKAEEAVLSGRGEGGRRNFGCSGRGPGEGCRGTEGGTGDDGGGVSAAGLLMFSKRARSDETGLIEEPSGPSSSGGGGMVEAEAGGRRGVECEAHTDGV